MNFFGKKVLVCGVARSGISASILLKKLGAKVTIQDIKKTISKEDENILLNENINILLGQNPSKQMIDTFDLLVLSPGISSELEFIQYAKERKPVLSEIELAYLNCKSKLVAITGTNGKTTTTTLVGEIAKKFYEKVEVVGNIGVAFSEKVLKIRKEGLFIAEISSFQLENINKFRPNVSAVLNITPDHLNRHKTIENYIKAKERIFENQTEKDFLILNYNDEVCVKMEKKTKAEVMYFNIKNSLDIDKKIKVFLDGNIIYTNFNNKLEKFIDINDLKILGLHNIENVMASILISYAISIPMDIIKETILNFKAVEHRNEFVRSIKNVDYYNDSKATNVDASIKAIESMKKPIILIAGGYDKNVDFTEFIRILKNKVKKLILIGECKEKIIKYCNEQEFYNYEECINLKDAVNLSYKLAEEGDCVLLSPACASWDMFKDFEERGNLFKEFVLNLRGE